MNFVTKEAKKESSIKPTDSATDQPQKSKAQLSKERRELQVILPSSIKR